METGALQGLFNQKTTQQITTAEFRPGQIINGKILKLYPEQVAEVQIGNQKMIAQLEAPLSANQRYWFQVQPGDGKVHLKVIGSGTEDKGQPGSLAKILGEFSIQPTKENIELVRFFIKEQLPVNRELLKQASEWLSSVDSRSAGQDAMKLILTRGIPVTQAAFEAVYTTTKEQSLVLLMDKLEKALDPALNSDAGASLKKLLNEMLPSNKILTSEAALNNLAAIWLKQDGKESQGALELLKQLGAISSRGSESLVLQQMLAKLQSYGTSGDELPEGLNYVKNIITHINNGERSLAIQMISSLIPEKNLSVNELVESLKMLFYRAPGKESEFQQGLQAFKQILSMVSDGESLSILLGGKDGWRQAGMDMLKAAGQPQSGNLTGLHAQLLSEAISKAEQPPPLQEAGTALLADTKIKKFLSSLGLSYEYQLGEVLKDGETGRAQVSETLKSLVLRLLNENPPPAVKEASELLLNKLTGFQLLSQEAGPIQQLVVQIPFVLGEKMTELTMQWSGKKTSDGKIDADFCRVLFYLKLENLNDLIVDMQVQNRVMSVQIFNENAALKKMSEQMMPVLKSKLAEINYHLSSVHFHVPGKSQSGKNQRSLSDFYSQKEYSGVDIKI
ncbi:MULTISPECIES: hypothetical protein [unclassified Bacillus (in: firmicutes)]|uniref:hypothetical protein n=1 Tax=unclassified Bacillus (in: firmicutes) TaxID=185979 RepID=UPI001BE96F92|nr:MULTISPECIES: hypothetical protein [unclassified Bacillus (in: firmicutes)]MBT2637156.1 hypothetical protein [Bacillus sp. ISL-39]MBT2660228.1 hypothetical protein [Bacillus sp. ISL-45]